MVTKRSTTPRRKSTAPRPVKAPVVVSPEAAEVAAEVTRAPQPDVTTPNLPRLSDTYQKPNATGVYDVAVAPGYVVSFWIDDERGRLKAKAEGIHLPAIEEGFFLEPYLLTSNEVGLVTLGEYVLGVETLAHFAHRKRAKQEEASVFLTSMRARAAQQGKGAGTAPFVANFREGKTERDLPDLTAEMAAMKH